MGLSSGENANLQFKKSGGVDTNKDIVVNQAQQSKEVQRLLEKVRDDLQKRTDFN